MAVSASLLNLIGVLFLSHAVYSAYEHSLLRDSSQAPPASSVLPRSLDPKIDLPTDIVLETLISAILLCFGVVLSSPQLKPIQWNVWAGRMERSAKAREIKGVGLGQGNPYMGLEERPGFLDIRGKKKHFAAWAKDNGAKGES